MSEKNYFFDWLISDVDGVLTCGGHFYTKKKKSLKRFSSNDKEAINEILKKFVKNIIFITGDKSGFEISKKRIRDMGFNLKYVCSKRRNEFIKSLRGSKVYIGDGIFDGDVNVDLLLSLKDSTPQVQEKSSFVLNTEGGRNVFSHVLFYFENKYRENDDISKTINQSKILEKNKNKIYDFCKEVVKFYKDTNKIIFCGVGKNALLADVVCEFLAPYNITAISLDPHRALHGNLGILNKDDILILISKSGNTKELHMFLEALKNKTEMEALFLLTSNIEAELNKNFIFKKSLFVDSNIEISRFGHSPQTTTILYLIVLFSLVNCLTENKNITEREYLKNHQSGEIGKLLKC